MPKSLFSLDQAGDSACRPHTHTDWMEPKDRLGIGDSAEVKRLADRPMYTLVDICIHLAVGVTFYVCIETPQFKPITHLPYPQPTPLTIYLVPGGFTSRRDSGGYVVTFECTQNCIQICIQCDTMPVVYWVRMVGAVVSFGLVARSTFPYVNFSSLARGLGRIYARLPGRSMLACHVVFSMLMWLLHALQNCSLLQRQRNPKW